MKKGFTLVELLAVIVILAVIAVIATPIVLNIINQAKENSTLKSAQLYIDGVDQSILLSRLNSSKIKNGTYSIMEDGNICIGKFENNICDGDILKLEIKGEPPTKGTVKIKNNKVQGIDIILNDKKVWTEPFTGELEYKLEPGVYDKNDKLLMSWDALDQPTRDLTNDEFNTFKDVLEAGGHNEGGFGYAGEIFDSIKDSYKLVIADDVECIGGYAFWRSSLKNIIIPGSVKSIGEHAFDICENLTNVIIENGVTSIGYNSFSSCTSLASIIISESVISIGDNAFSYSGLTSIPKLNSNVTLGNNVFSSCNNLKEITVPINVLSVGMFGDCDNLTKITIEEGATELDYYDIDGLISLKEIIIPESVTSIDSFAFWGCENLTTIYYKGNAEGAPWGAPNAEVISNF